ncbi:hypothetical protein [Bacillus sp. 3255]|uniref:hypothetical protein n=1 Tax=Bacillus sp. 3255 TaxID=2817904 RepID=UPI002861ACA9|nr:hypothetical protein [Bacillus sp. 3255]MDR6878971.1 hypothetical protein [Bacillus sp. 3255]
MNRLIVLSLLLVLLTACKASLDKGRVSSAPMESSAVESNILIDKSSNKNESVDVNSVYGDYLSGSSIGWFSTIIKDNPIDMDYAKENNELQNSKDFNTSTWLELEKK